MERFGRNGSSPCRKCDEYDDFIFLTDDEQLNIEPKVCRARSPAKAIVENVLVPAVMTALTTVASTEGLLVTNIAKTVLTGAASTLSAASIGVVPGVAVGALIAGGLFAYKTLRNKSAIEILQSLSPQQQKQLVIQLKNGLNRHGVKDIAVDILHRKEVRDAALDILSSFLSDRFNVKLVRA